MATTVIIAVLAAAIGLLVGWLLSRPRTIALSERLTATEAEKERRQAVAETLTEQLTALRSQIGALQAEKQQLQVDYSTLQRELALLREQMQRDDIRRNEAFEKQLLMAREQMQNATQKLLDQRAEALGKTNTEQMTGVVGPLKEQLAAMQKQVNESLKTSVESRTSIEKAIENLMRRTAEMAGEANNLARALRNENKTQGNWGEMVLDTILEKSGLQKGLHYETQVTLRDAQGKVLVGDESGQRMIPDVIVHYPDGKDVIVDSKVSLTAYIDYCNAETDSERDDALERHTASVRQHVRELRQKDYASYIMPPRQALQYMIMFVPNEAALQLAMHHDPSLWREAFDRGVCITSEQNLIVLLRMIQLAWTQVQQFENQQQIMAQAKTLLDRVALFIERFNRIDAGIDDLRRRYNEANITLTGRQRILVAAREMQNLGAKTSSTRSLPELPTLPMDDNTDNDTNPEP